jgi:tetratricopeptide (TPR) repeat protein
MTDVSSTRKPVPYRPTLKQLLPRPSDNRVVDLAFLRFIVLAAAAACAAPTAIDPHRAEPGRADAREDLARSMMQLERWKEARDQLLRLIELEPRRADAHHLLGVTELETRHLAEAERQFLKCLELDPYHPECNYELGRVYLATERLEEAILVLVVAARLPSPVQPSAQQNLRIAYQRTALRDGAVVALIDRCKHEPGNADCRYDLGTVFAERGLYEQATREWEEAVRLGPNQCAAHHRLAMEAHRAFDTATAESECRATIECARRTVDAAFQEMAGECREILRAPR